MRQLRASAFGLSWPIGLCLAAFLGLPASARTNSPRFTPGCFFWRIAWAGTLLRTARRSGAC